MTDSFNSIRTQLDLIPYGSCHDYMYVKSASFEPCYLSDDLDAVMRLYKEAGFWGNAWDFTKNLGLSTVGLADDKHQWMNYITPIAMMAIPGVGLAGGAVRAGVTGLGRLAAGQGAKFLVGQGTKLIARNALQQATKQTAKQVGKTIANQGAKQIVKRRGLNMATGYKPRVNMPTTNQWIETMNNQVLPNGVKKMPLKLKDPRTGQLFRAKPLPGQSNVVSNAVTNQAANAATNQTAQHAFKRMGRQLRNMEQGAGRYWGSNAWNGMSGGQKALDIARGVLWGGSKNKAVNWGSWAVPYLASNFTDNKYIDNWATARTNLGFMSPGLNRLSGWGAKRMMPGQMRPFRPAGPMRQPAQPKVQTQMNVNNSPMQPPAQTGQNFRTRTYSTVFTGMDPRFATQTQYAYAY